MKKLTVLFLSICLGLVACAPAEATPEPTSTSSVDAIYTQAAATISVQLTQTEQARPTNTPTNTPTPTETPTITPTPEAPTQAPVSGAVPTINQSTANGCYNSIWVADVTVPSGSGFKPGDTFTKTWRVKNSGTCDWKANTKIAFVNGDPLGAATTLIDQDVKVGATIDISVPMKAPNNGGFLTTTWQLLSPEGMYFGPAMSFTIVLPGASIPATATPSYAGGCPNSQAISVSVHNVKKKVNEAFTQSFTFRNSGSCDWTFNYLIFFVGGELFGSDTTKIRQVVGPGFNGTINLEMVAPSTPGLYSSTWQLMSDGGELFGQDIVFTIEVEE